jgi:hypothetical protein
MVFEVRFWDNWAEEPDAGLPVGGVSLPGFGILATISMLGAAAIMQRREED